MEWHGSELNKLVVVSIRKQWIKTHFTLGTERCHVATITYAPNTNCFIFRSSDHVTTITSKTCPSHNITMSLENEWGRLWPCGWIHRSGRNIPNRGSLIIASNNQIGIGRTEGNWPTLMGNVRNGNKGIWRQDKQKAIRGSFVPDSYGVSFEWVVHIDHLID